MLGAEGQLNWTCRGQTLERDANKNGSMDASSKWVMTKGTLPFHALPVLLALRFKDRQYPGKRRQESPPSSMCINQTKTLSILHELRVVCMRAGLSVPCGRAIISCCLHLQDRLTVFEQFLSTEAVMVYKGPGWAMCHELLFREV